MDNFKKYIESLAQMGEFNTDLTGIRNLFKDAKELSQLVQNTDVTPTQQQAVESENSVTISQIQETIEAVKKSVEIIRRIDSYLLGIEKSAKLTGFALPATFVDFLLSSINLLRYMRKIEGEEKKEATKQFIKELKNVAKLLPGSFLTGITLWAFIPLAHMAPVFVVIMIINKIVYWVSWYCMMITSKLQEKDNDSPFWNAISNGFRNLMPDRFGDVMFKKESTIPELYQSTVDAFPNTTKRQHATQPIEIKNLEYLPFKGMKTLFVKALAKNEDRQYEPMVLFKNVQYSNPGIKILDSTGMTFEFKPINTQDSDILLRCNCNDFKFRFAYYDHLDKSLYGRKPKKYESKGGFPANPKEMPGMCKHCIKLIEVIRESNIFN